MSDISFGALVPPMSEQVPYLSKEDAELFDRLNYAITLLSIHSVVSEAEKRNIHRRIIKRIAQAERGGGRVSAPYNYGYVYTTTGGAMSEETRIDQEATFRSELEELLNSNSMENGSNTPDFILATYLSRCLAAFDEAVLWREEWYERKPRQTTTKEVSGE